MIRGLSNGTGTSMPVSLPPNAMIFRVKRAGVVWFYDSRSKIAILLSREGPTLANPDAPLSIGGKLAGLRAIPDLDKILQGWEGHFTSTFIIDGEGEQETIDVLAILNL